MPQWHGNLDKKKRSGGRKGILRGKRAREAGNAAAATIMGETKTRRRRCKGGSFKMTLLASSVANVVDPATGRSEKTQITRVLRNAANVDYERRGVITKGALIETSLGQAKVVSRPGQDGVINAVLTKKTE